MAPMTSRQPRRSADDARLRALRPDPKQATPRYLQLVVSLGEAIRAGRWHPGEALPSERALCQVLGVSRITLRTAMDVLAEQGLVERRQGAGTFVSHAVEYPMTRLTGFSELLRFRGLRPQTTWLRRRVRAASVDEAVRLGLKPGDAVVELERLRQAGREVMAHERSVLPQRFVADTAEVGDSLYAYLDAHGTPVERALQHFHAVNAGARLAAHLKLRRGTAVLRVTRVGYLADGTPIELTDTHCRSDHYDFVAELRR